MITINILILTYLPKYCFIQNQNIYFEKKKFKSEKE